MAYAGEGELGMKTAAEMTVEELKAWLKQRRAQLMQVERDALIRSKILSAETARANNKLPPISAMHTRRAMQRRRNK